MEKMKCPKCQIDNPDKQEFCGLCGTKLVPDRPTEQKSPPPDKDISVSPTETVEAPREELTTGSTFAARFQIIEELGKGGMGRVYKALDKEVKEKIAIKLIKPEISADEKTIERFRNELKLARQISHKNVCRMYDLNKEDGAYYITMEYVSGEDLKSFIRRAGVLGAGKAIYIAQQVCEGLTEAHRLGVIHRDLKPQNIMIDKDGNAKIMDFGIARSLKTKGITGSGVMIGTPDYMSPEQVEGKETDERSDIYSLGVILYEMVTGQVPFEGDTPFAIGVKHKSVPPIPPIEKNPQVPEYLNRIILRCLVKDKEKRYSSAEELHTELDYVAKTLPTTEKLIPKKEPTASEEITVTVKKRWVWVTLPILVIIVAAVLAYFFLQKKEEDVLPPGRRVLVVLPFKNLGQAEDEYFATGTSNEIRSRLSDLHGLDVISGASSNLYKDTQKSIRQIREELGVDFVLSGTVQWSKAEVEQDQVLIIAELIRTLDDTPVWSERYTRSVEHIFRIQAEIAEDVTKKLDLKLLKPERDALRTKPTENLEAYNYFLRAENHSLQAFTLQSYEEYEKAIELYEKAIELDPGFVQAYVELSEAHSATYHYGFDRTKERIEKSKAAVDKALALQPDLPEVLEALALYHYRGFRDYDRALEMFETVQKARPNNPLNLLGYIQRRKGKWEESKKTLESSFKLNPRSSELASNIGLNCVRMRRYEEAVLWCDRALSLNPDSFPAKTWKIVALGLGKWAIDEVKSVINTLPPSPLADFAWYLVLSQEKNYPEVLRRLNSLPYESYEAQGLFFGRELSLASVYHAQGRRSQQRTHANAARERLEQLVQDHPDDPRYRTSLGSAYAYLGRGEDAVRECKQAINLFPISLDAVVGPGYVMDLTRIYAIIGEYENALDNLEYLLSIPAGNVLSVKLLENEALWDPLRENPRFMALIEKYSTEKPEE
jgi:serine/threonine protein kinase/Flp pilus assembly protein TadD